MVTNRRDVLDVVWHESLEEMVVSKLGWDSTRSLRMGHVSYKCGTRRREGELVGREAYKDDSSILRSTESCKFRNRSGVSPGAFKYVAAADILAKYAKLMQRGAKEKEEVCSEKLLRTGGDRQPEYMHAQRRTWTGAGKGSSTGAEDSYAQ